MDAQGMEGEEWDELQRNLMATIPVYDRINRFATLGQVSRWRKMVREKLPEGRVLEIGCGSGYQAAVLTYLCRRVYSMERLKPLLVDAENRLRDLRISNISLRHGDGVKGWPEAAPFDRIILTCGSAKIPDILLQQLKIDGIMVAPEGTDSAQQLVVITRRESGFEREVLMPVTFVPLIEGC